MNQSHDGLSFTEETIPNESPSSIEEILRTGTEEEIQAFIKSDYCTSPPGRFFLMNALIKRFKEQRLEISLLAGWQRSMLTRFLRIEGDAPLLLIPNIDENDIRDLKIGGISTIQTLVALTRRKRILKILKGDETRVRRLLATLTAEGFPLMSLGEFRRMIKKIRVESVR